jgi:hypothetical protein
MNFANTVNQATKKKVVITVHDAARLRSTQMFGAQDPYVVAFIETNKRKRVKTHVDTDGGAEPSWNRKLPSLDYTHANKTDIICFEIWNENSMSDALIGQCACRLTELFNPSERSVNLPVNYQGERVGSSILRISAHFTDRKTVARHGASVLQSAVVSGPTSYHDKHDSSATRRASQVSQPSSVSQPAGSAQWAVGKSDPSDAARVAPTAVATSTGPSVSIGGGGGGGGRFRAAVTRATGPSVSIGMGGSAVSNNRSFNNNTGTGIGFRGGYNPKVKTATNVAFAANAFRGGMQQNARPTGPSASFASPYSQPVTVQSFGQQRPPVAAAQAYPSVAAVSPYPNAVSSYPRSQPPVRVQPFGYGRPQPPVAAVQPYPSASSMASPYPNATAVSSYPNSPYPNAQPVQPVVVQPVQAQQAYYAQPIANPNIQKIRSVVGNGPTDARLNQLLGAAGGDVSRAIGMYYQNQ